MNLFILYLVKQSGSGRFKVSTGTDVIGLRDLEVRIALDGALLLARVSTFEA